MTESPTSSDSSAAKPEVVYTPNSGTGLGLWAWRNMFAELRDSRELTWRLFVRDFTTRYRQSLLGYAWAVISILVPVVTFTWLSSANIIPIGNTGLPYPLFLLVNFTVWQLFATGVSVTSQSLVAAGPLLTKIRFPRESLVLAAFGNSIAELLVRVLVVAIAFPLFDAAPAGTVVLVPLALVPLCLFTLGLGFLFALLNAIFRDIGQAIGFLLTFWMFVTPVIYPFPANASELLAIANPLTAFVVAANDLTTTGILSHPTAYLAASVASVFVFLVGWRVFYATGPRIAERL